MFRGLFFVLKSIEILDYLVTVLKSDNLWMSSISMTLAYESSTIGHSFWEVEEYS